MPLTPVTGATMRTQPRFIKMSFLLMLVALHLCCGGLTGRAKRQAFDFSVTPPPPGANHSIGGAFGPAGSSDLPFTLGCLGDAICQQQPCENGGTCLFNASNCTFTCQCADGSLSDILCQDVSGPTSTTGPVDEKDCLHNGQFVCQHGRCAGEEPYFYCKCDEGWSGVFCDEECSLKCENGGKCNADNGGQYCNCIYPWKGKTCSEKPPPEKDTTWIYWLAGCLVAAFVVITGMFVLLTAFVWRRRFVLIMKVVFYFLPYEDNDGKLFDAFVSYRSCPEDLEFVYGMLHPRLEQDLKFKLCLHERDFLPGETIANNILWAVENSRRTILVLSPNYLESEWTRFEYQQAQQEMLKRKQKIIPIMFRDVTDHLQSMDKTLKTILQSVTYLDLPKAASDEQRLEKFWKRLQLSMPKKKDTPDSTYTLDSAGLPSRQDTPNNIPASDLILGRKTSSGKVSAVSDGSVHLDPSLFGHGAKKGQEKDDNVQLVSLRFIQGGWTMESDECRGQLEEIAKAHERTLDGFI